MITERMKTKKHQYGKVQNLKWEKNKIKYGSMGVPFDLVDVIKLLI